MCFLLVVTSLTLGTNLNALAFVLISVLGIMRRSDVRPVSALNQRVITSTLSSKGLGYQLPSLVKAQRVPHAEKLKSTLVRLFMAPSMITRHTFQPSALPKPPDTFDGAGMNSTFTPYLRVPRIVPVSSLSHQPVGPNTNG